MSSFRAIALATTLALFLVSTQAVIKTDEHGNVIQRLQERPASTVGGPWLVQLDSENDFESVKKALKNKKGSVKRELKSKSKTKTKTQLLVVDDISEEEIKSIPGVKNVEIDGEVHATGITPRSGAWGVDRSDQPDLPLDNFYETDYPGCGTDVYVADTGLNTLHEQFTSNQAHTREVINVWSDYGSNTDNNDGNGHGTHCAGSVGGSTVGVAACANIYGIKVLSDTGSGSWSSVIAGMEHARFSHVNKGAGAKSVLSMSLGGGASSSIDSKVQECVEAGLIVVVAAGNDGSSADNYSPARAPNAITVGASDSSDRMASFSNYGSRIDIFAPGVSISSASGSSNTGYNIYSGTSMACPHVAGLVAGFLQKANIEMNDAADVATITNQMKASAAPGKISQAPSGTTTDLAQRPPCVDCTPYPTDPSVPQPTPSPTADGYIPAELPYSASATSSATTNTDDFFMKLCPDNEIQLSSCDSFSGDPYLRVYRGNSNIHSNDDGCPNSVASIITFTPPACDTYRLARGCYGSGSCSGVVKFSKTPIAGTPTGAPIVAPPSPPVDNSPTPRPTPRPTSMCEHCAGIDNGGVCKSECRTSCYWSRGRCYQR